MDAYQQFKTVMFRWFRFIGVCLGLDIVRPDFRPNAYTAFTIIVTFSLPCLCVYTIYNFDGFIRISSSAFLGTRIKVAMKLITMLIARPRTVETIKFLGQIHEQNQCTTENSLAFQRFSGIFKSCVKALIVYMTTCVGIALAIPIIVYVKKGTRQMILPVFLPGMSIDSNLQYAVNMIYQTTVMIIGVLGYTFFDLLFIVQLLHVILMTDILRHKMRAISEMAAVNSRASHFEVAVNLRNVINLHNELRRYMVNLQDHYYYPITIIVAFAVGSIGFKIYAILTAETAIPFFYVLIFAETLELAYFCAMGTMVDVFYDRFYDELLACKWYQLSLSQQKAYILLLNAAKEPNNLNVADIMPLNVNTFMIMANRIYSFVIVLRNTI